MCSVGSGNGYVYFRVIDSSGQPLAQSPKLNELAMFELQPSGAREAMLTNLVAAEIGSFRVEFSHTPLPDPPLPSTTESEKEQWYPKSFELQQIAFALTMTRGAVPALKIAGSTGTTYLNVSVLKLEQDAHQLLLNSGEREKRTEERETQHKGQLYDLPFYSSPPL